MQFPIREIERIFAKVDDRTIYFESMPDYADNARALFDEMIRRKMNRKYRFIWATDEEIPALKGIRNVINIRKSDKIKVVKALYRSRYIFYTHGMSGWIRPKKGQTIVNLWHGCGYKASRNSHITKKFSLTRIANRGKNCFDYALVPGRAFIEPKSKFFSCSRDKILPLGYPRYDLLHSDRTGWDRLKEHLDIREKKVILWMPTYRQTDDPQLKEGKTSNPFFLPMLRSFDELKLLDQLCGELGETIIVKRHRKQLEQGGDYPLDELKHIRFMDDDDLLAVDAQLYQILPWSDALITDYSSVGVDYVLVDKPMAFLLDDFEEYRALRGFTFEDPREYMPGEKVVNTEQLKKFLQEIAEGADPGKTIRESLRGEIQNPCENYCERLLKRFHLI